MGGAAVSVAVGVIVGSAIVGVAVGVTTGVGVTVDGGISVTSGVTGDMASVGVLTGVRVSEGVNVTDGGVSVDTPAVAVCASDTAAGLANRMLVAGIISTKRPNSAPNKKEGRATRAIKAIVRIFSEKT